MRWQDIPTFYADLYVRSAMSAKALMFTCLIVDILDSEARAGRMYTMTLFAEAFENKSGLSGQTTIRDGRSFAQVKVERLGVGRCGGAARDRVLWSSAPLDRGMGGQATAQFVKASIRLMMERIFLVSRSI